MKKSIVAGVHRAKSQIPAEVAMLKPPFVEGTGRQHIIGRTLFAAARTYSSLDLFKLPWAINIDHHLDCSTLVM